MKRAHRFFGHLYSSSRYFICAVVVLLPLVADGQTNSFILSPVSDAFGADQPFDGIYDSIFPLSPANIVGGTANAEYRSALEFQLPTIPMKATVQSAKLDLYQVAASGGGGQMNVFARPYVGDGVADISDLVGAGPSVGPVTVTLGGPVRMAEFDVTTAIQIRYQSGGPYVGFVLYAVPTSFVYQFGSVDNPIVDARPTLSVVYAVPEPATGILSIGFAVMCFLWLQTDKKSFRCPDCANLV